MVTHTSIMDLMGLNISGFTRVYGTIARVLDKWKGSD